MKLRTVLTAALVLSLTVASVEAGFDGLGAPDTVDLVVTVAPYAAGGQMQLQMDLYVFNDSNDVYGATMGFSWDNPNLQMDSAEATELAKLFELGPYLYEDSDIDLTNANQRFLFAGAKMFDTGIPPGDTRRLWASYYFTLSSWNVNDSIVFDTMWYSSSTVYKFIGGQGVGNYFPVFVGGPVIHDPDYTEPVNLIVTPDSLGFTSVEGGSNPSGQTFQVASDGDPIFFELNEDANWLIVTPIQGTTVQTINVGVNAISLSAGEYIDTIEVISSGAVNSPQLVVVTLSVEEPAPAIAVDPGEFFFNAIAGGDNPASRVLTITNSSASVLQWTVSNSESWLSLAPASGTDSGDVTLSVDITGLSYADYYDTIVVTDPAASNDPVLVPVNLSVGSDLPIIETDSAGYTVIVGAVPSIPDRTISILNGGAGTLNFWLEEDSPRILAMNPDSGSAPQAVAINFKAQAGSPPNDYWDTIWVYSNEAINSPHPVELHFIYRETPAHMNVNMDTVNLDVYECSMGYQGILPSRSFVVNNLGGDDPMPITLTYESDYFTIWPDTGTASAAFTISAEYVELPVGTYLDSIMISAPNAENSPLYIEVHYNVLVGIETPEIVVPTDQYVLPTQENSGPRPPAMMAIYNKYGGCMEWELIDSIPWLYPTVVSGDVPAALSFNLNSAGFPFGEYEDTLLVIAASASNSPKRIPVRMRVWRFHGDNDYDGIITIADLVYMVDYMFNNGPRPQPQLHVGDLTCDLFVNIDDLVYMVDYMFGGGPIPCGNPY